MSGRSTYGMKWHKSWLKVCLDPVTLLIGMIIGQAILLVYLAIAGEWIPN